MDMVQILNILNTYQPTDPILEYKKDIGTAISEEDITDLYYDASTNCQQLMLQARAAGSVTRKNITALATEYYEISNMAKQALESLRDDDVPKAVLIYDHAHNKLESAANKWGSISESASIESKKEICRKCGNSTGFPGVKLCDACYKKSYESALTNSNQKRRSTDMNESAPPDQESWVRKNKKRFKKEYGDKKGTEILYKTAWTRHNKTNEAVDKDSCKNCGEDGIVPCQSCKGQEGNKNCKECKGHGELSCPSCKGSGRMKIKESEDLSDILRLSGLQEDVNSGAPIRDGSSERYIRTHSGDEMIAPNEHEAREYYRAVKDKDWDKVLRFEESWEYYMGEASHPDIPGSDDYCDACMQEVANHETDHGILCDKCYDDIYGDGEIRESATLTDSLKNIKRGISGWDPELDATPASVLSRVKSSSTEFLQNIVRTCQDKEGHSPASLQYKAARRELRNRQDIKENQLNESNGYYVEVEYLNGRTPNKFVRFNYGSGENEFNLVSDKESATILDDLGEAKSKASSVKMHSGMGQVKVKVRPNLNEHIEKLKGGKYRLLSKKGNKNLGTYNSKAGAEKREGQVEYFKHMKEAKTMNEGLTRQRGVPENDAPKSWANEPNEQIAGWRAVVDDADGLSKSVDMYPWRVGDNQMKVASNKKSKKIHENTEVTKLAEKLQNKFNAINENEARFAAHQLSFVELAQKLESEGFEHNQTREAEINHSAHIFTRGESEFVSVSKDGKYDWAYHTPEGDIHEGEGRSSLFKLFDEVESEFGEDNLGYEVTPEVEDELAGMHSVQPRKFNKCQNCHGIGCRECFGSGEYVVGPNSHHYD